MGIFVDIFWNRLKWTPQSVLFLNLSWRKVAKWIFGQVGIGFAPIYVSVLRMWRLIEMSRLSPGIMGHYCSKTISKTISVPVCLIRFVTVQRDL